MISSTRKLMAGVALAAALHSPWAVANESDPTVIRYTNARVFNGALFELRDICVAGTLLTACEKAVENVVDMNGAYITSPIGDAHTHHFDSEFTLDWHTQLGLQSGAFYAMNLTAVSTQVEEIRDRMRGFGRVDAISSTGGITGPESHPAEIYEAIAIGAYSYEDQLARMAEIRASRKVADNAYYVVEQAADIDRKWPLIMSREPDLIKVYLRSSERYDDGFGKWGPGGGIDPDLLPRIREKTDEAGLRLAVATSTVSDFRTAVQSRADIVTHPPCYQDTGSDPESPYYSIVTDRQCLIQAADAQLAADAGTTVVLIASEWAKDRPAKVVAREMQNIQTLRSAGVGFAIGSNAYGAALTEGLIAGVQKEFLGPAELLRIATLDSPRLIFPKRRVGCMEAGCEASFIAFERNPLTDITAIADIVYRLKDGVPVTLNSEN